MSSEELYQMFTLHGLFKPQVVLFIYTLLIGNETSDYDHSFERITEAGDYNPGSILTDFQSGT